MADLVPGGIFLEEKSFLDLGNSKVITNEPWVASLVKLHVWSLEFGSLAILVPRHLKMGNYINGPWVYQVWHL